MLNPAQRDLVQEATPLSKTVPLLGEAYRHVSSSAVLSDFRARLAQANLPPAIAEPYTLSEP